MGSLPGRQGQHVHADMHRSLHAQLAVDAFIRHRNPAARCVHWKLCDLVAKRHQDSCKGLPLACTGLRHLDYRLDDIPSTG